MPLPSGLYVLTEERQQPLTRLCERVASAIAGGATAVQYRDKSHDAARRRQEAGALQALCSARNITFIVNDDVELALEVGADGVHVGRDDLPVAEARARMGPAAIVGASCYDSLALARQAQQAGASYVAFGSFFPSPTKPAAARPVPALLAAARREFAIPPVAIGGITPRNAAALLEAGAHALAVLSSVLGALDPEPAARAYSQLFERVRTE